MRALAALWLLCAAWLWGGREETGSPAYLATWRSSISHAERCGWSGVEHLDGHITRLPRQGGALTGARRRSDAAMVTGTTGTPAWIADTKPSLLNGGARPRLRWGLGKHPDLIPPDRPWLLHPGIHLRSGHVRRRRRSDRPRGPASHPRGAGPESARGRGRASPTRPGASPRRRSCSSVWERRCTGAPALPVGGCPPRTPDRNAWPRHIRRNEPCASVIAPSRTDVPRPSYGR